ncbi:hypothetical protein [uncultured Bacteroides sp.]|jgi:hypothetical protein|nr:hypothetical protein [uncultured Bacteroides sp.]
MKKEPAKPAAYMPKKNGQVVKPTGKRIGKSRPAKANNQQNRRVK